MNLRNSELIKILKVDLQLLTLYALYQKREMVRLTADLIWKSPHFFNALKERELDHRGNKIPVIENLGATEVKIQQAQDLILQMKEKLSSISRNLDIERTDHILWSLSRRELTPKRTCWFGSSESTFHEGYYKHHRVQVQPITIEEQDELIQNLRYKLLQESKCMAEEKKLIQHIKQAEEIRETLVANRKPESPHTNNPKNIANHMEVYRAKLQKMKHEQKWVESTGSIRKKLQSCHELSIQMNKKRGEVHSLIYDLVKQQGQLP